MNETNKNNRILSLLFVGVLMGALDISIVGPAIPSIGKTILMNNHDLSWIFSVYVLFNLVGIPLMAKLSDFFGRRMIYITAVAIFGFGSLIVALSHDITWLLIGRGIQGFGSSGIFPVASAVIGDVFPIEKRGRALGMIGAVFGIAFMTGPFIAGFMLHYFDWNSLFLINLPIAILVITGAWFLLPSERNIESKDFDWEGIIMMVMILTSYTIGMNLIRGDMFFDSLSSFPVLFLLLLTVIMTPFLFIIESGKKEPVFDVRLFHSRQAAFAGLIAVGIGFLQSSILFIPTISVNLFGVTPAKASFMLLPLVVATAIGSPLGGRLVDKIGSRIIIFSGMLLSSAGLFLFSRMSGNTTLFYLAEALMGFGLAIRSSLNYIMLSEAPLKERASTQGVLIIFVSIGQITGVALVGAVGSSAGKSLDGIGNAFLVMSGLSFFLVILSAFLKNHRKEIDTKPQIS